MAVARTTYPTIDFTDERLDNGLRLVMAPDHLVPVVAVNLWYDVGSKHEVPGRTGIAHLFEHMMFQGSRNAAKGEHFGLIEKVGGSLNATTSLHRTNYFETAPSHTLELLLWLEADRMGGLLDALGQETLDNQRDVVKNEKRQGMDNQPYGTWLKNMLAAVFPEGHPYHHPTIGSMADLSAASLSDVQQFFRTYYAPNNATLSIVGDFDPPQARAWVQRYFGGITANADIPAAPDLTAQIGLGTSRRVVPDRVPLSRIYVGFRAPEAGSRGVDATQMAAAVLAGTEGGVSKGSRVYKRLVREKRLAQDVNFGLFELSGVSMVYGMLTARPGADIDDVEAGFYEVLESLAKEGPSEDEMVRARAGIERAIVDEYFTRAGGRADRLSECATVYGDPRRANETLPRLLDISADEIAKAAAEVLHEGNRATLVYVPGEKEEDGDAE
jgi:predicted Zn-dependent peptidase